jgi:hypothetical protein
MFKFLVTPFLIICFATPALAKSKDVYPDSCSDLWAAVMDTLGNQHNYGIILEDDLRRRVSFVVVGALVHYTETVALAARDGGCVAKANIIELGPDNDDWRQFHHRLAKSLTKLQAAKPKLAATAAGQP